MYLLKLRINPNLQNWQLSFLWPQKYNLLFSKQSDISNNMNLCNYNIMQL